ncbi:MAG: hypothetical protein WAO83_23740 [Fuerstiella sp.]
MRIAIFLSFCFTGIWCSFALGSDYCVVARKSTVQDANWKEVVDALLQKHNGVLLTYQTSPTESLAELSKLHPRYTCFVATADEATADFVATVHKSTRGFDDDPFTDTLWGILTGYDAANALTIAKHKAPLVVRKVASGTELATDMCQQARCYDELVKNKLVVKEAGQPGKEVAGPDDTTKALVDTLNEFQPDLMVTSGHATERNWQIGFRYRNGYFKSSAGQMYGEDSLRQRFEIDSQNPKVYLPIGNCLMGHIDGPDAMALAWMNDVGVKQMIGYTVPTWFGYGGWGVLDYFVEQPGRYTLTEAFFANHHALVHALQTKTGNERGLAFDRDVVAFYGDPKWEARMADADKAYDQTLTQDGDVYTFKITPRRGEDSFRPINTNGSQRGWRPMIQWLPERVSDVKIISGSEFQPVITDDFILMPNPRSCVETTSYEVRFTAKPMLQK